MNKSQICPHCGAVLEAGTVDAICPKCLLHQALAGSGSVALPKTVIAEPGSVQSISEPASADRKQGAHGDEDVPTHLRYFGDYEILEEIARGGMGIVYKARQTSLNRIVAVKVILSGELATSNEVKRFYTEAEAAANLQHPNIVAIHEVGEHGRHYFSMDYVEGTDLEKQLRQGPLDPIQAATILKKVTQAVGYAHMQGTFHRDLKPSNVLLDANGEPRVTDFGLAKRSNDREGITLSGTVLGTPAYMAPEQASGHVEQIDGRTDVYGLGAVLFAMLTGRAPFTGGTALAVMRLVTDTQPEAPSKLNPKVPVALETICLKCLEKNPGNRYASAIDLAADLNRFLQGQPIHAQPASALMRVMDRLRQNPWIVTGALSFLVLTLLLGAYGLWDYARFILWKGAHPDQKPPFIAFENLFGTAPLSRLGAWGFVTFYAYMVFGPASSYSNFAKLKRADQLTSRALLRGAGTALLNMVLAAAMMCRVAHMAIWYDGQERGTAKLFAALLLPAFWFGAHLFWLAVIEWRGRHFGEKSEEAKAVYGKGTVLFPSANWIRRSYVNPCLAFVAMFEITTTLLPSDTTTFGVWWSVIGALAVMFSNRRALLDWKSDSRISNQLFWFVAILGAAYLVLLFGGMAMFLFREPAKGVLNLSIAVVSAIAACSWSLRLNKCSTPASVWDASRLGQWLTHTTVGQNTIPVLLGAVWFPFAGSWSWVLAMLLARQMVKDSLELLLRPEHRRISELGVTLGLSGLILFWFQVLSRPVTFEVAVALGLAFGWIEATTYLFTMPASNRPGKTWRLLWAAEFAVMFAAVCLYFPNISEISARRAGLRALDDPKMFIDNSPESLSFGAEPLIKAYLDLGLVDDGAAYFKRIASRFPNNSPGAFKARWALAETLRKGSRAAEAAAVYQQLSSQYHLIPARHWQLAGPFPASTALQPSDPSATNLPSPWMPAESVASVLFGYLDFKPLLGTNDAASAKSVWHGRLHILSREDQEVSLGFGLAVRATATLNDQEILRARHTDRLNLDNARVQATLFKGENVLVLRMTAATEFPAMILRILDLGGNPIANLSFRP